MQKQTILFLLSSILLFSGTAQPEIPKFYEKFDKEIRKKHFLNEIDFRNENLFLPQKQNPQTKGGDWYEPDTIYNYQTSAPLSRSIFSYKNGKCITLLYQFWRNEKWTDDTKITFTYNTHKKMTEQWWKIWESGKWVNKYKYTYVFDENNNATSGYYQIWSGGGWKNADEVAGVYIYYNNMQSNISILYCHKFTATYAKVSNGIKEYNNLVKLFPNPVTNILNIETLNSNKIPETKIYSIQGALLLNTKGSQIDVSSLPSGIYIAKIDGVSRKFVKL